jgi:hypothetical protein
LPYPPSPVSFECRGTPSMRDWACSRR